MNAAENNSKKSFYSVFLSYLLACAIVAFIVILILYSSIFKKQQSDAILRADNTLKQIKYVLENYFNTDDFMSYLNADELHAMGLNDVSNSGYWYELKNISKDGTETILLSTLRDSTSVEKAEASFLGYDWTLSVCPKTGWAGIKDLFQYIITFIFLVFLISYLLAKNTLSEQEKREAFKAVEEANAAKTEFLSNISHDIRTPMNAIVGMVQIAIKNINDKARVLECLAKVELSSEHLLTLINSVLDMNKLETDRFEFPEEPFDMELLVRDCISVIEPLALSSSITIHSHLAAVREFRYLFGSPVHVKQIIINILTNAVKYNKQGGTVDIFCDNRFLHDDLCEYIFIFKDNGIGMSDEFMKKLFTPFSQEDSSARTNYTGSGLGLSIVKMMVEKLGGSVSVESEKNVGSTFTVTIPFKIDSKRIASTPQEKFFINADITGSNILLVEDNTLNMEIALYALEEAGADVTCAMNGKEAIEAFESESDKVPFDIVLMDIMMPVMDGYEATMAIRKSNKPNAKTVKIIALTANAFADDIKRCKEAGMDGHLAKPININEMIKTISELKS